MKTIKAFSVHFPASVRRPLYWGVLGLICSGLIAFLIANIYSIPLALIVFLVLGVLLLTALTMHLNVLYQEPLVALASKLAPQSAGRALDIADQFAQIEQNLSLIAENLNIRSREVSELAERLQSIFDATEEAIIAIRAPKELLAANMAAYRLFELPKSAVVPTAESFFFKAPPIIGIIETCLKEGHAFLDQFSMLKDNHELILTAKGRRFRVGDTDGVVIVINDITSLKKMELLKKNFVANVSHELRTPVQIIKGYAELLDGAEIDEECHSWARVIGHQAERMERIVADLLMLAKLEQDPASWIVKERFPLRSVLAEAVRTLRLQYVDSGAIELDCPQDLEVYANPGLIEQAAFNLMANAVQHSGSHEKILVSVTQEDHDVVLRVRDFGAGIAPKDLAHIFERFYRADRVRSSVSGSGISHSPPSGSSGLGLAIVKHIALAHGGTVRAESWAGEGSLFEFRFPNVTENAGAVDPPRGLPSVPLASSEQAPMPNQDMSTEAP